MRQSLVISKPRVDWDRDGRLVGVVTLRVKGLSPVTLQELARHATAGNPAGVVRLLQDSLKLKVPAEVVEPQEVRCVRCRRMLAHVAEQTLVVRHKGRVFFVEAPATVRMKCPRCEAMQAISMEGEGGV